MTPRPAADALGAELRQAIAEGWMPGAVWQIDDARGVLDCGAVGDSALLGAPPSPASFGTVYDLASLTKPLVSAPLLLLAHQAEELDVDAPLADYLDAFDGSPYAQTTLRQLATHVSGMPAWHPCYLTADDLAGYLRVIAGLAPEPSERPRYSDLGFIVLGAVLETACGQTLDRLFEERLATPLGLTSARFVRGDEPDLEAAPTELGNAYERELCGAPGASYRWRKDLIRGRVHDVNAFQLGGVAGHAGLFASIGDVVRLARWALDPQEPRLTATLRDWLLGPTADPVERTVGWVTAGGSDAVPDCFPTHAPGHLGFTGTSVWLDPARQRSMVLLTNRVHPEVQSRGLEPVRRRFHRHAYDL